MTTCKNCDTGFEGKFCPDCGQKAKTKRITTKIVFDELRKSLVHYDQGFLYTVIHLFRRPGHMVREFLEGKRVLYTKPIKFLIWATALNFLVFHFIGLDRDMMHTIAEQQPKRKISAQMTQWIFDHPSVMYFLMIPNIALFSWLYFRRRGYNYAEHVVLNSYTMGAVGLLGVVLNPLLKFAVPAPSLFYGKIAFQTLTWMSYMGWAYGQFFQPARRKWLTWLKCVLAIFSGYLMLFVVVSLLITLIVLFFMPLIRPYLAE